MGKRQASRSQGVSQEPALKIIIRSVWVLSGGSSPPVFSAHGLGISLLITDDNLAFICERAKFSSGLYPPPSLFLTWTLCITSDNWENGDSPVTQDNADSANSKYKMLLKWKLFSPVAQVVVKPIPTGHLRSLFITLHDITLHDITLRYRLLSRATYSKCSVVNYYIWSCLTYTHLMRVP